MELSQDYLDQFHNIHRINTETFYDIQGDFGENFTNLLKELNCEKFYRRNILDALWNAMNSPKTYYHTPVHILSIFAFKQKHSIDISKEQELALWFHDAIYRPGSKENEYNSIMFMQSLLTDTGIDKKVIQTASEYISLTEHHLEDTVAFDDGKLIMDLDMNGFSADREIFNKQNEMIELEFCQPKVEGYGCSEYDFITGRLKFLNALASKKSIYRTQWFLDNCEKTAQENLAYVICETNKRLSNLPL
jgi:predicted metal-dependent HD superfamily phosphohydrolase